MYKMKKIILIVIATIFFQTIFAQSIPIYSWQDHLSYKSGTSVSEGGGKVSFGKALGRTACEIIGSQICYIYHIGCVVAAFDDEKRALHDHICSTRVIKIR